MVGGLLAAALAVTYCSFSRRSSPSRVSVLSTTVVPDSLTWTPTAAARERTVMPDWIGVEIWMS
jgi:hypothetical protein